MPAHQRLRALWLVLRVAIVILAVLWAAAFPGLLVLARSLAAPGVDKTL